MFVVASSLLERAFRQFYVCLFLKYPDRMNEYIGGEKHKGKIDLISVIEAESKDTLIIQLAERSAASAAKGRILDIMKRLRELSNCREEDFPLALQNEITNIVEHRNVVVHEKIPIPCRLVEVENLFEEAGKMLDVLDSLASIGDIPSNRDGHCILWADEEFYE